MSYVCDNCHKRTIYGRTQTHKRGVAGKRWRKRAQMTLRVFKPNLQRTTVMVAGVATKMRLCTSCIKKFKKDGKIKTRSQAQYLGTPA